MIYIAAPYSHPDKSVVTHRVKIVCEYSAYLLRQKISCVSPITTGTGILTHATLPTDFEFWQYFSYDLLTVCTGIHILKLDGWNESIGVTGEINFAIQQLIDIDYIEQDYLESLLLKK